MSIVRVGLAETKRFADGYDAIFGKKVKSAAPAKKTTKTKTTKAKPAAPKKKKPAKKK